MEELTNANTWLGLPAQQWAFPIMVVEGWQAIALSCRIKEEHEQNHQWMEQVFCQVNLTCRFEFILMDGGTDKDDDNTYRSSPMVWSSGWFPGYLGLMGTCVCYTDSEPASEPHPFSHSA